MRPGPSRRWLAVQSMPRMCTVRSWRTFPACRLEQPYSPRRRRKQQHIRVQSVDGFYEVLTRYGIAKGKAHLVCGDPAIELPRLARSIRAGLVVMGAISRSGFKRIFIGNTAEHTLDGLQCDLLVVKRSGITVPV